MLATRAMINGNTSVLYDANHDGRVDLFDLIAIATDAGYSPSTD
jgi:hypothetical protein